MSGKFELYPLYKRCSKYSRLRHIQNAQLSANLRQFVIDYKQLLSRPTTIFRRGQSPFEFLSQNFLRLLPVYCFGSKQNNRLFRKFLKKIVNCSYHECLFCRFVTKGFRLESIKWLADHLTVSEKYEQLRAVIFYLGEKVKRMLKKFFFVAQSYSKLPYERLLIPRHHWNSFKDQILNDLKKKKFMKNAKNLPSPLRCHGSLKILPKSADLNKYRLVIRNNNEFKKSQNWRYCRQQIMQIVVKSFPERVRTNELYKCWLEFVTVAKKHNLPVYGILIDLADAFGNVNVQKLYKSIKYYAFKKTAMSAKQSAVLMNILRNFLEDGAPLVLVGKTGNGQRSEDSRLFEWNHGLLQGHMLSSVLCEFDRAQFEDTFLFDFQKPNVFLHRTVDDYFLCSTDLNVISKFHNIMSTECCVNREKIQSNCLEFTENASNEITYNGIVFNLNSFETSINVTVDRKVPAKSKFKVWNINRKYKSFKE